MKKILAAFVFLMAAVAQATTITNLAVTAQSGTSMTVQWTTDVASNSQLLYGIGNLGGGTPVVPALVTSHTITISGLQLGQTYNYQAQSSDSFGNLAKSAVQVFTICNPSLQNPGLTAVNGNINNYYEYGIYTFTWVNTTVYNISPTVCGQPLQQTFTGNLDSASSLNILIPDSNQIVPSQSEWSVNVTGINGSIGSITVEQALTPNSNSLTAPLRAAAVGQLIHVWYDPATATFFPPVMSGTTLSLEHNGAALTDQTLLNFNDTTPAPTSGSANVLFQSDSGGDLSAHVGLQALGAPFAVSGTSVVFAATPSVGSNYSAVPSITLTGGNCATNPTVKDFFTTSGAIGFQITNGGNCPGGTPPTVVVGSDATGSGAGATLAIQGSTLQYGPTGVPFQGLNSGFGQVLMQQSPFMITPVVEGLSIAAGGISVIPAINTTNCPNPWFSLEDNNVLFTGSCSTASSIIFQPGLVNSPTIQLEPATVSLDTIDIYAINSNNSIGFNPFNLGANLALPQNAGLDWKLKSDGPLVVEAFNGGGGYTNAGTCALSGGVQLSGGTDTCATSLSSGVIQLAITNNGLWSTPPVAVITGAVGGTGANLTFTPSINHPTIFSGSFWQDVTANTRFHLTGTQKGVTGGDWMTVGSNFFALPGLAPGSGTDCLLIAASTGAVTAGSCSGSGSGYTSTTGDVISSGSGAVATTVVGINGTNLAALGTGLLKNATGTGVPSIAVPGTDYLTPTGSATGLSKASASAFGVAECDGTTITCSGGVFTAVAGGSASFSALTSGTNTGAAMLVGTGASLAPTGSGTITPSAINLAISGNGGVTGNLPNANLATQAANVVLGTLTATTPSGLTVPSCSGPTNALTWVNGTGFGCNTISGGGGSGTVSGQASGVIPLGTSATVIGAQSHMDDGNTTTATITSTEPVVAPSFSASGTTNGLIDLVATGTSPGAAPTNGIQVEAPSSVTAYRLELPGAAPTSGNTILSCTAASPSVCSFGSVSLSTQVSGNLPNANLATQTANTVLGALTATTPSGLAVPSCSGASNALTWTTGTGFGCNTISGGGGGLPTGTTGQTIFYATGGTTGTATSALIINGTTAGSAVGIGNATPLNTADVTGTESLVGSGPTANTTTNGALAAAATTMTVVSTTGYPTSGFLWLGNGSQFHGEIVSYSGTTGTTFTGLTRSLFGTTANTSLNTGSFVALISYFETDSLTGQATYVKLFKGAVLHWPGANQWANGSVFGTNSEIFGDPVTINAALTMSNGAISGATSVQSALYQTTTTCSNNGTSANPSVVTCTNTAAPAGFFSCAVAASGGTCTVATTAVTASSTIIVQEVASVGTALGVTCNTAPTAAPAITLVSQTAGTGFTINVPTITTNPACYTFQVIN